MNKDLNKLKDYCSNFTRDLTDSQKDLINDFFAEEELRQHYELDSDINSINDLLNIHNRLQNFLPQFKRNYLRSRQKALTILLNLLEPEIDKKNNEFGLIYFLYSKELLAIEAYFERS